MSSKQVRAYKDGLLNLEHRGERYVPLNNIINNTTELTHNTTKTLPPKESEVVKKAVPNLIKNDVCIQNHPNETNCYLLGEYPASMAVTSAFLTLIKMLHLFLVL